LTYWTKHPSRLNRDLGRKAWGDEGYTREELLPTWELLSYALTSLSRRKFATTPPIYRALAQSAEERQARNIQRSGTRAESDRSPKEFPAKRTANRRLKPSPGRRSPPLPSPSVRSSRLSNEPYLLLL